MKVLTVILQELKRNFLNIRIAAVFAGIVFLNYYVAAGYAKDCKNIADAVIYTAGGMKLYPILSVPLAMWGIGYSLREDIQYGHISNISMRLNCRVYLIVKMFCSVLTFTIINTAAILTVAGILNLSYPMIGERGVDYSGGSFALLADGDYLGFLVVVGIFNSLLFSVYLLISELLSIYADNDFFIYFSPIVVFYMIINISYFIQLPAYLLPASVFYCGGTGVFESLPQGMLYAVAYIIALEILINLIFVKKHWKLRKV